MLDSVLFEAFSRCYEPPGWVIEDFAESGSLPVREALQAELENVSDTALLSLGPDEMAHAVSFFSATDVERRKRLYILGQRIGDSIERALISEVAKVPHAEAHPYGHPALTGIDVDSEGLVALSAFRIEGDSLCVGDHAFFVMPPVPGSNSTSWLLEQLQRHQLTDMVRVRLDPWLHGPSKHLSGRGYKATIWGQPLDWNRIRLLREPEFGQWVPGKFSRPSSQTDYVWNPHGNEVDFLCEELPVVDDVDVRGARYLHAVYNKDLHQITHLDGAVRIYNSDSIDARLRAPTHVRNVGKVGTRVKIFRTDSAVSPEVLSSIATAYFYWNYDVARYFGEQLPADF